MRGLLGDAYEDARIARKNEAFSDAPKPAPPTSKANKDSKATKQAKKEEVIEEKTELDEEAEAAEEDVDMDKVEEAEAAPTDGDELAEIDGVKPKRHIADGEELEAKSMTRYDHGDMFAIVC